MPLRRRGRPLGARSSSAAAVVPSGSPAARIRPPSAVPELIGSTQPRRPQRQGGPAGSTGMWPSWPAAARPRTMRPSSIRPPPMPVPMVSRARWRAPRPAPRRASAISAMLASLSMVDRTGEALLDRLDQRDRREVDDSRPTSTARRAKSTRPGTPMPMAATAGVSTSAMSAIEPRQHLGGIAGAGRAGPGEDGPVGRHPRRTQVACRRCRCRWRRALRPVGASGARQRRGHGVRPRPWPSASRSPPASRAAAGPRSSRGRWRVIGAVERDAVLPQRAAGDDARGAVRHRGLDLAEEGLVVDAGRQHRPRHVARDPGDRGAGLGGARDRGSSSTFAPCSRQSREPPSISSAVFAA